MFSRRSLLLASLGPACVGLYAGIEPLFFGLKRYEVRASSRPEHLRLKVAVVADIHACEPWMKLRHIEEIVEATNALGADVIALLGDYVAGHDKITAVVPDRDWARALSRLRAPSGVYAILGNHDWWADAAAQTRGRGPIAARVALENAGITVLENDCASVSKNGERSGLRASAINWRFANGVPGAQDTRVGSTISRRLQRWSATRRPLYCWRTNRTFFRRFQDELR
jgi:uncharacterized protein